MSAVDQRSGVSMLYLCWQPGHVSHSATSVPEAHGPDGVLLRYVKNSCDSSLRAFPRRVYRKGNVCGGKISANRGGRNRCSALYRQVSDALELKASSGGSRKMPLDFPLGLQALASRPREVSLDLLCSCKPIAGGPKKVSLDLQAAPKLKTGTRCRGGHTYR